jgi:hypothetical protein
MDNACVVYMHYMESTSATYEAIFKQCISNI